MLKRRGRSFDSFYPTTPRDSVGKRQPFLRSSIINHLPDFIRFFFFYFEFFFRLLMRFDNVRFLVPYVVSQRVLFLNIHVSSAKKISITKYAMKRKFVAFESLKL